MNNMSQIGISTFNGTCSRTICEQYLRILFSSFGEEDFQMFALNLLCSNLFPGYYIPGYYFQDNVGGGTI